jgi:broad specificity phosphatase PhoE
MRQDARMSEQSRGEIVLVRHGQTDWSEARRHTGTTDRQLTAEGERRAGAVGTALAGRRFALVLTSPRSRARRTAELAGLSGPEGRSEEPDLAEWDYGGYEGRTSADIAQDRGGQWWIWTDGVVPGDTPGESIEDVARRSRSVLERVRPVIDAGDDVALVGHGHALRVLTACWLGRPPVDGAMFKLSAGAYCVLGFEHEREVVVHWNIEAPEQTEQSG